MEKKQIQNHMPMVWHEVIESENEEPAAKAQLSDRATLVGRIGLLFLKSGTGAWRVREAMNNCADALGLACHVDVGLVTISMTVEEGTEASTRILSLPSSGINTRLLWRLHQFVDDFPEMAQRMTAEEIHAELDELVSSQKIYTPAVEGLASAAACAAFTFLLGGWIFEMIGAFVGAGLGNWLRDYMGTKKITLLGKTIPSVALACFSYFLTLRILSAAFGVSGSHITGYICAMLFVIPGFPLITGGIDLSKLDMRSGLERIAYAFVIILTATLTGWVTAMILRIHPNSFASLDFSQTTYLVLRLIMSFIGVFGFSLMYNSPAKMAGTAGLIGMVANTLRLELVNVFGVPGGAAAFLGAMTAGLLGSIVTKKIGYPRISLTIPSIVIMVPGMYLYRSVYNFGLDAVGEGAVWLIRGLMIILALPLGLICARLLTQKSFRHIS